MKTIIVGVTGSIAAYRACDIVNQLRKKQYDVHVILTECAKHFVTELTLRTLSNNKVYGEMFEKNQQWDPVHISLSKKANLIAVIPSTAQFIGKVSAGICDDLLSTIIISSEAPVLFAPAMNNRMYANPIVQENIVKLKDLGYHFVGPKEGHLACGETGMGHIQDDDTIINTVESLLNKDVN